MGSPALLRHCAGSAASAASDGGVTGTLLGRRPPGLHAGGAASSAVLAARSHGSRLGVEAAGSNSSLHKLKSLFLKKSR